MLMNIPPNKACFSYFSTKTYVECRKVFKFLPDVEPLSHGEAMTQI